MSHIFISYSRNDIDFAGKIVDSLAENKLDTWIDWKSIPKGEKWLDEIYRGIEEGDAFLFLISPDSVKSENCNKEIAHAVKNNKRIIPVVVRDADSKTIPSTISELNWIFCRYEIGKPQNAIDDFTKAIKETHKTIHTDYEWLKFHTSLQLKALEWERNDHEDSFLLHGKELEGAEKVFIANLGKEPIPTELQIQFIARSRNVENLQIAERKRTRERLRNRTLTIGGITIIAIIAAFLAVVFGSQVGSARISEQQAKETAQAEATTRAQAQATATIAQGREKEQTNIALAKGLAAQSKVLGLDSGTHFIQSSLLSIESLLRFDNLEASDAIRERLTLLPQKIYYRNIGQSVNSVVFDPAGELLAIGTGDNESKTGELIVLDATTCQELYSIPQNNPISFLEFSPDGKMILLGDKGGKIKLISSATGKVVFEDTSNVNQTGEGGEQAPFARFSPDGLLITVADFPNSRVLKSDTGEKIAEINIVAMYADFSYDGKYVVLAHVAGRVVVWDLISNQIIVDVKLIPVEIDYVKYIDDDYVVVRTPRGELIRIDIRTSEFNNIAKGLGVGPIDVSKNGERLAYYNNYLRTIIVLDTKTWTELYSIKNVAQLSSLDINDKTNVLATVGINGIAQVWDTKRLTPLISIPFGDSNWTSAQDISQNGELVVAGNLSGNIALFDLNPASQLLRVDYGRIEIGLTDWLQSVTGVAISPDGKYAASSAWGSGSTLIDINSKKLLLSKDCTNTTFSDDSRLFLMCNTLVYLPDLSEIYTFSNAKQTILSPNGNLVAYEASDDNPGATIVLWEVKSKKIIHEIPLNSESFTFEFQPDSRNLVINNQGELWFLNPMTGEVKEKVGSSNKVNTFTISANSKLLATIFSDGTINIQNLGTNTLLFKHQEDGINHSFIRINPNNTSFMVLRLDGFVEVWDINNNKSPLLTLTQDDLPQSAIFSHDGNYIVTGSQNGVVRVFSAMTGKELARMYHKDTNLENFVKYLAISKDDKYIMSGSYDGTARVWLWRPEDLISELCARLTRNLTYNEWKNFLGNQPYRATCPNLLIPTE